MVHLKFSVLWLILVAVKSSSAQLQLTCGFPTPTSVYTCGYQRDESITGQTNWITPTHPLGLGNANVELFYIRWAFIILIPVSTFTTFSNIQHLHIDESAFANVATNLPVPYMPLRRITLSGNSQFVIVNNAFLNFPNVNNLKINRNIFDTNLPTAAFNGLDSLLELDISGNSQLGMISNVFETLVHLTTLNLSDNNGMILNLESFSGLDNLIQLNMERSKLVELQAMIFFPLKKLQVLNLSGNEITQILDGSFLGLSSLRELYLTKNNIVTVTATGFSSFIALEHLDLSQNPDLLLTPLMFQPLPHLQKVNMSYNNIQYDALTPIALSYLLNLTSIDISHNNLTRISGDTFNGNIQLRSINLEKSNINAIQLNLFDRLTSAEVRINLEGNICTNYEFLVLNRNFHKIRDELRTCFNNFNQSAGHNVPKFAIILLMVIYFKGFF